MKKMTLFLCLALAWMLMSGCAASDEGKPGTNEAGLFPMEEIEGKFSDLRPGYLYMNQGEVSFQEAVFDYDDKAILYVKEYVDPDFVKYELGDDLEIYVIEFEDNITKYKKVDFDSFSQQFDPASTMPFYVKITDHQIQAIIEKYVP